MATHQDSRVKQAAQKALDTKKPSQKQAIQEQVTQAAEAPKARLKFTEESAETQTRFINIVTMPNNPQYQEAIGSIGAFLRSPDVSEDKKTATRELLRAQLRDADVRGQNAVILDLIKAKPVTTPKFNDKDDDDE